MPRRLRPAAEPEGAAKRRLLEKLLTLQAHKARRADAEGAADAARRRMEHTRRLLADLDARHGA